MEADMSNEMLQTDQLLAALCRELNALAQQEDDAAAAEAATVPYWMPQPTSVQGRRAAARVLREEAARLDAATRPRLVTVAA
jgi:hypothetical protein